MIDWLLKYPEALIVVWAAWLVFVGALGYRFREWADDAFSDDSPTLFDQDAPCEPSFF